MFQKKMLYVCCAMSDVMSSTVESFVELIGAILVATLRASAGCECDANL